MLYHLCILNYGEGQEAYHCFDPVTKKLYFTCQVLLLGHIPFFSIPDNSQNMTKSELICIYPFSDGIENPHSHAPCIINTSCTTGTNATYQVVLDVPSLSMASQIPTTIVDHPPHLQYPRCSR